MRKGGRILRALRLFCGNSHTLGIQGSGKPTGIILLDKSNKQSIGLGLLHRKNLFHSLVPRFFQVQFPSHESLIQFGPLSCIQLIRHAHAQFTKIIAIGFVGFAGHQAFLIGNLEDGR